MRICILLLDHIIDNMLLYDSSMVTVTTLPLPPAPPTLQLQATDQNSLKAVLEKEAGQGIHVHIGNKELKRKVSPTIIIVEIQWTLLNIIGYY